MSQDLLSVPHLEPADRYSLNPRKQAAYLLGEWREMLRPASFLSDAPAAIAVALVALPLSLAIANASGVAPEIGLITAIVGGIVVALFGGCRLQVSGPAAAMTFLVYEVLTKYGPQGLITATLIAGALQVVAGWFRLGRFIQFIPRPVVAGFLSGIGLTILCTQLPVILNIGLNHDEEGGAIGLLLQTVRGLAQTNWRSLAVGATAIAAMRLVPRLSRKLPTPLIAVVAASLLPLLMGWNSVELLGELPRTLPMPRLPDVPWTMWNEVVMAALTIFLLASIESLLSASVVDSLDKTTHVDNDQELVGQGLGNLASALFGGIPVTGVIARSATNIQSGARTRLSAILHALLLVVSILFLGPLVSRIPLAALAGVLTAVALRMIEFRMLRTLWRVSRPEAIVFLVTLSAILITDLIDGVQIGMIATAIYFIYEMSRLNVRPATLSANLPVPLAGGARASATTPAPAGALADCPSVLVVHVEGPLFFASGFHLKNLTARLTSFSCVILDLGGVPYLDMTGAEILDEELGTLDRNHVRILLANVSQALRDRLSHLGTEFFTTLPRIPIFEDVNDAMRHAENAIAQRELCARCAHRDRCEALESILDTPRSGHESAAR